MNSKTVTKLIGILAICTIFLWATGSNIAAAVALGELIRVIANWKPFTAQLRDWFAGS